MKIKKSVPVYFGLLVALTLTGCPAPTTTSPSSSDSAYPDSGKNQTSDSNLAYPASSPSAMVSAPASAPFPSAQASLNPALPTVTTGAFPSSNATPIPSPSPEESKTKDNFFLNYGVNPFFDTTQDKLSTFAVDVDTASYTWMRKSLLSNIMVAKDSVRTEEYLNYFDYGYPKPATGKFSINTDLVNSRFADKNIKTLRIGIQGTEVNTVNRKDANLIFVIDVSGSMNMENRLGLVKESLEILLRQLKKNDKVGIIVFGSTARVVLEPTSIDKEDQIITAIRSLSPEGSTNTEAGLRLGYQMAEKNFKSGAINRIVLCSDGVANVGETGPDAILTKIQQESEAGITLSTIGFGMGNYNDVLMEKLADKGDGNYAYVDTLKEAQRIFTENLTGMLQIIAKDVKVQVEFNPDVVSQYRLLGYENRNIADKDFRNDAVDAGEIGSNHSVTAIYELKMKDGVISGKIGDIKLRYKDIDNLNTVLEISKSTDLSELVNFDKTSNSMKLAIAVEEYAEILRGSPFAVDNNLKNVLTVAESVNTNQDVKISEFVTLINKAISLEK